MYTKQSSTHATQVQHTYETGVYKTDISTFAKDTHPCFERYVSIGAKWQLL